MTDSTTLLLVEDDLGLRTFLADNLTADGFDVLLADSVRDAVRLLEYKQPDLALVDLGLPDGSGLDLIRRVREADGVASRLDPGLPLVILTGRVSELDRVRGFDRSLPTEPLPKGWRLTVAPRCRQAVASAEQTVGTPINGPWPPPSARGVAGAKGMQHLDEQTATPENRMGRPASSAQRRQAGDQREGGRRSDVSSRRQQRGGHL